MTLSVLWTLLPNGLNADATRARLSLVASPRIVGPLTKLPTDSDLARWPTVVTHRMAGLTVVTAGSRGGGESHIQATVVSPPPEQALWDQLVPYRTSKIAPFEEGGTPILVASETAYSLKPAIDTIAPLYREITSLEQAQGLQQHPVHNLMEGLHTWMNHSAGASAAQLDARQAINAPNVMELLDPQRLTAARIEQAVNFLHQQGYPAAAAALPLIPILNRLQVAYDASSKDAASAFAHPSILAPISTPDQADLHQILGFYLDHPILALRLGLRFDLEIPVFTGQQLIRIGDANGVPLDGEVPLPQPWSAVVCDPANQRFTMATQPDVTGVEIRDGMLDLRSGSDGQQYLVTDLDPVSFTEQLATVASTATMTTHTLPVRRDVGIVIAQVDRRTQTLEYRIQRMARFDSGQGPNEVKGSPVLFADDVTIGYRIDVARNGGQFKSLMRRQMTYFQSDPLVKSPPKIIAGLTDEGWLEPFTPVEQRDKSGKPHLFIGEEVCRWNGWSLAAPQPGLVVGAENAGADQITVPDRRPFPQVPLLVDMSVEPGTLTRLRYGDTYQFRARSVDLAGNSLTSEEANSALATAPFRFLRHEPVPAPTLVPRRPFTPGESLLRLVVRSDGDGQVLGATCERHVAAPKCSQHQAERHGLFDSAFGPNGSVAERDRMLAIAKREAGTFLDPTVLGPGGAPVKASGIRVATNVGAPPPQTILPIIRGEGLPSGEYVIHDTDQAVLPYLPDVVSAGSAWVGLPGAVGPVIVPWSDRPWPERPPHRIVLQAGTTGQTNVLPSSTANRAPVLTVTIPPTVEIQVQLSSSLTPEGLAVMDPISSEHRKAAIAGQLPLLSPTQTLTLIHVVRKPLQAPTLTLKQLLDKASDEDRPQGSTWARLHGTVTAHAPSSAKVDVVGTWTEITDRGYGPVLYEPRSSTSGSVLVDLKDTEDLAFEAIHELGDTKRRIISYQPVATTRFREYFIGLEEGEQSLVREGDPVVVDIPSARRPDPPQIHSVIPLLRQSRTVANGQLTCTQACIGVRIYLKRPWFTSGEGERLGVSLSTTAEFGNSLSQFDALRNLVSRWGCDPFQSSDPGEAPPLLSDMILNGKERRDSAKIPDNPEGSLGHTIVGLEVQFDAERDLWFADLELDLVKSHLYNERFPMLKLALVRFQPGTFEFSPECSRLVHTDLIPLLPRRTLTVSKEILGNQMVIHLSVTGSRLSPIIATWQRRMLDPLTQTTSDIYVDATDIPSASLTLHFAPPVINPSGVPISIDETQPRSGSGQLNSAGVIGTALQELLAGRIVVREQEPTWSLVRPTGGDRTVWFETFNLHEIEDLELQKSTH